MGSKPFRFKQFSIDDEKCTHKVGTDGVLLGSWVNIQATDNFLLDIGTGSGLIAIMLAQRTNATAHIDAIEIDKEDAAQARNNVLLSPWPQKITVWHTAIQAFAATHLYDVVISNPPFFVNSLRPPEGKRGQARHTHNLPFDDLLQSVTRLLAPHGRFAIILPYAESAIFLKAALSEQLFALRTTAFRSRKHKPIERVLFEFGKKKLPEVVSEVALYEDGDEWTESYRNLTKDFYLKA